MRIGYFLSTEEYGPAELVEQAQAAERAGFEGLWISDHFHPWNNEQGNSPFVWSVIGAISQVCDLPVTTAVTCPTVRTHPAIIAQAAATSAEMLDGKFTLGVGSGEALNEHILGTVWPSADVRLEMLEEAVALIRELWTGEVVTTEGKHYRVDHARIYNLPETTARHLRLGVRSQGHRAGGPHRRRLHQHRSGRRAAQRLQGEVGRQAGPGRRQGRLRADAPRRAGSTPTGCGPTRDFPGRWPRCCPRRSTSSRPPSW